MTTEEEITRWVIESTTKENVKDPIVTITGTTDKGDNYSGDISFVTVTGDNGNNESTAFDIVIKTGKRNVKMRETGIDVLYQREIYVYDKMFPTFHQFQMGHNCENLFNSVPKCYKTLQEKDVEIIVLENLKSKGFKLHDRQVNMNVHHMKLVLKNYAKLHAVSLSMRDQNPDQFNEIVANATPVLGQLLLNGFKDVFQQMYDKQMKYIREVDSELYTQMDNIFGPILMDTFLEVYNAEVEDPVIIHGDCWNNNFMFKYEVRIFIYFE